MKVRLVSFTPFPVDMMASVAAITRGLTQREFVEKYKRSDMERLLRECYESGHLSVFEFSDWDFEVQGASRVFETQAVRSRIGSYEWESGRHDQKYEAADFIKNYQSGDMQAAMSLGLGGYRLLTDDGYPPEDARYILPQGVARKGRIKKNFRALMETAGLRLCSHAQAEYREFMQECKRLVTGVDPFLGSLLVPRCEYFGYCPEVRKPCGHMKTKAEVLGK